MVEFSYEEASSLLKKNLENAQGNYTTFVHIYFGLYYFFLNLFFFFFCIYIQKEEDLNFLKD